MGPKVERIAEGAVVAEGPYWDVENQALYFVDIYGKSVNRYDPITKKHTKASLAPKQASFMIPVKGRKNTFIVGLGHQLALLSWDRQSDQASILEILAAVEKPAVFNDAKCDTSGRLWTGSVAITDLDDFEGTKPLGSLYKFDGKLQTQLKNIKVSNGLDFNHQSGKMYFIDSLKYGIDQFDFDSSTGTISNGRTWFSLKQHGLTGMPDGMTTDSDGNLWVANFGSGKVLKVDGKNPEILLQTIEIPSKQVTSVAFGGRNLDELYVTTGNLAFLGLEPNPPIDGATYKVTGIGARGNPPNQFSFK